MIGATEDCEVLPMTRLVDLPLGIYEKSICMNQTWADKFSLARDSGYDYFEIAIDGSEERLARLDDRDEKIRIRRAAEALDMTLYTMAFTANRFFPLGSEDEGIRQRGMALLKSCIDFAAMIGIRVIHIAAYDEVKNPSTLMTAALFRQSIETCINHAAHRGVIIAFETMDSRFLDSTRKIMEFVHAFDSPWLQAVSDLGNITAMGNNPVTDIPAGGRHVVAIHIKDTLPTELRRIPFGTGTVDFDACFRTLSEMNYQGFLVAEMWCWEDPAFHPYIRQARDFLKAKMAAFSY